MLFLCVFCPYFFHCFLCRILPAPCRFLSAKQNTVDLIKTSLAIRICILPDYQNRTDSVTFSPANMLLFSKQKQVFTK